MQLRRAMEIINSKDKDAIIYYKDKQVNILSVDNNIGTACVETLNGDLKFETDLEQLTEKNKYM